MDRGAINSLCVSSRWPLYRIVSDTRLAVTVIGFAGLWLSIPGSTVPRWIGWSLITIALALASLILLTILGVALTTLFHL